MNKNVIWYLSASFAALLIAVSFEPFDFFSTLLAMLNILVGTCCFHNGLTKYKEHNESSESSKLEQSEPET